ncbi:hypothetical protein A1OE_11 [Candidatus Endolissoclinum faulkneri L2]|uniref:Uncharacterized protein n=1 Tax=Candidatus Endolissoclinum faulkneri L2 TaxID=1193729 RepID=K7ZC23_9PROT|nr:hypothetical protein A1OE_11 [Candidatus Endolissoclinum faulkneri L2]
MLFFFRSIAKVITITSRTKTNFSLLPNIFKIHRIPEQIRVGKLLVCLN